MLIGSALVLAISSMLHPMFGAQRVFGFYKPHDIISERHIAPLLNANHLAAYINIGFCLALGMGLERRADRYRPDRDRGGDPLRGDPGSWPSPSRGGALAMVFGGVCVLLTSQVSRRFTMKRGASFILPGLVVVAGVAMVVIAATPEAVSEMSSLDASKLRIAASALPLALRYPLRRGPRRVRGRSSFRPHLRGLRELHAPRGTSWCSG